MGGALPFLVLKRDKIPVGLFSEDVHVSVFSYTHADTCTHIEFLKVKLKLAASGIFEMLGESMEVISTLKT